MMAQSCLSSIQELQEIMLEQGTLLTAQTDEEYTSPSGKSAFDQFLRAAVDAPFADCAPAAMARSLRWRVETLDAMFFGP